MPRTPYWNKIILTSVAALVLSHLPVFLIQSDHAQALESELSLFRSPNSNLPRSWEEAPETLNIPAGWLEETERTWQETARLLREHAGCLGHASSGLYAEMDRVLKERDTARRAKNTGKLAEIEARLTKIKEQLARMTKNPDATDFVVHHIRAGNEYSVGGIRASDINNVHYSCDDIFHTHPLDPRINAYASVEFSAPDIHGFLENHWSNVYVLRHREGYSMMLKTKKTPSSSLSRQQLGSVLFLHYFFSDIENGPKPHPNDIRAFLGSYQIAHYRGGPDGRLRKEPRQQSFTDDEGKLLERSPLYTQPSVALLLKGILYARGQFDGPWTFEFDEELWTALRQHYKNPERVVTGGVLQRVFDGTKPSRRKIGSDLGPSVEFESLKGSPLQQENDGTARGSSIYLSTRYLFHGHEFYIGRVGHFNEFPSFSLRFPEGAGSFLVCKTRLNGQVLLLGRERRNNPTDRLPAYIEEGTTREFCRLESGPYKIQYSNGARFEGFYDKDRKQMRLRTANGDFAIYSGIGDLTTGVSLATVLPGTR